MKARSTAYGPIVDDGLGCSMEATHPRLGSTRPLLQPLACGGTEGPSDTYGLVAGLSWLPGTAASAALKPLREWVPSQKGFVVEPPQRHRANGRFGIG